MPLAVPHVLRLVVVWLVSDTQLEEGGTDWRSDLIQALVEVYKRERLGLEAELHMLRLQQADQEHAHSIKNLDNRLREQVS